MWPLSSCSKSEATSTYHKQDQQFYALEVAREREVAARATATQTGRPAMSESRCVSVDLSPRVFLTGNWIPFLRHGACKFAARSTHDNRVHEGNDMIHVPAARSPLPSAPRHRGTQQRMGAAMGEVGHIFEIHALRRKPDEKLAVSLSLRDVKPLIPPAGNSCAAWKMSEMPSRELYAPHIVFCLFRFLSCSKTSYTPTWVTMSS